MKITERYFPHPVLTYFDDSIDGKFEITEFEAVLDADKAHYTISGLFVTDNLNLMGLIDDQKAAYVMHLECGKTRYRQPFHFFEARFSLKVPSDKLDGKVEMQPAITAKQAITDYTNSKAHEDFLDVNFDLRMGELLAVAYPMEFTVSKSLDSLRSIPSIFSISKNAQYEDLPMDVNFGDDKRIRIYLSEENYKRYKITSKHSINEPILASMILLPALVQLFNYFAHGTEQFEDTQWYPAIQRRIKECGHVFEDINWEDDALTIAHEVIGDALTNGLKVLADNGDD